MEHEAAERAKAAAAASGDSPASSPEAQQPTSPQATLEEMSLQQSMDKNKESLKRKLMMRRSVNELVDQGIYPPLKTPPAFAEQRKHLERAKTGDLLRHKIQQRPDRQQLVQQHILEDTKIDPSLHERQRQLKRARLADDLNDKLSHRPGPLELVQGNILKSDDKLREALQDGIISFSKTEEGKFDEDSTSEGAPSPSQGEDSNLSDIGSPPIIPIAPPVPEIKSTIQIKRSVPLNTLTPAALTKLSPITTQSFSVTNVGPITSLGSTLSSKNGNYSGNGVNKTRPKKPKPKTQPKSKVIKFHEYKGPPNSSKSGQNGNSNSGSSNSTTSETSYHYLLQQQQLFLQWQLEFHQKNLNNLPLLLPAQKLEGQLPVSAQNVSAANVVMSPPISTSNTTMAMHTDIPAAQVSPQLQTQVVPQIQQTTVTPQVQTQVQQPQAIISTQQPQSVIQPTVIHHPLSPPQQGQPQVQVQPQIIGQQTLTTAQNKPTLPPQTRIITNPPPVQNKSLSNTSNKIVTGTVQKPLSNLEEMKVADLKAELKKRNLPVSGSKPQLIERLKPYSDIIITASSGNANNKASGETMTTLSRLPVQAVVNVKQQSVVTSSEETVKSHSPPPSSPANIENILTNPLSPEGMEITSPTLNVSIPNQIKNQTALTAKSMASMTIDSQPPSVASLAPLDSAMDVDSLDLCASFSPPSVSQPSPTTITFVASPQQSPSHQIHLVQSAPGQLQALDSSTNEQQQIQFVHSPPVNNSSDAQIQLVQSPPVVQKTEEQVTHEQLLQQQQHKIQELQKQLEESQLRLKLQQLQHHQLQQQQQQLQHLKQQTQLLQQPTSPVNISTNNILPVSSEDKSLLQSVAGTGTKIVQLPAQTVKTVIGNGAQLVSTGTPLTAQGLPAVFVTANTDNKKVNTKPNLSEFFKNQSNVNIVKPVASSDQVDFQQPLVVASGAKTITLTAPINGLTQTRTTSLPSSPVEGKTVITRTTSNPYFIPLKEPPKYDEAVRSKNLQLSPVKLALSEAITMAKSTGATKNNPSIKSQAMDDVLEILIRSGELPPSAAQEPPPTPKTTGQATIPSVSVTKCVQSVSPLAITSSCASTTTVVSSSVTTAQPDVSSLLNGPVVFTDTTKVKEECVTPPPPLIVMSPQPVDTDNICPETDHTDLLDINEMLNQDLSAMDWTSDPTFPSLDLADSVNMQTDQDIKPGCSRDMLNIPVVQVNDPNSQIVHGSEPDLASLGLNDPENSNSMQMDVSDWLDVIMPSTGLTPLSATAPVSFPSDPILTPKTQQEVLELFNFEDADFSNPSDLQGGINWDKFTETTSST